MLRRSTSQQHDGEYEYKGVRYCAMFPLEILHKIPHYHYKPDDILLASYPKSGTRWVQEILYGLVHNGEVKDAQNKDLNDRFPFMEFSLGKLWPAGLSLIDQMESPRMMKTHLQRGFFDKPIFEGIKMIILIRNPKDVITAYYHFYQFMPMYYNCIDGFKGFFDIYQEKRLAHGDWFDWILSWYPEINNPNCLFVKFEDLKEDPKREIVRIANHIGLEPSDDVINEVKQYASFRNLKDIRMRRYKTEKEGVGQLRKGIVGDWKNLFNKEQSDYVDEMMKKKLKGCSLAYEY